MDGFPPKTTFDLFTDVQFKTFFFHKLLKITANNVSQNVKKHADPKLPSSTG